jgi:hypothetical protein
MMEHPLAPPRVRDLWRDRTTALPIRVVDERQYLARARWRDQMIEAGMERYVAGQDRSLAA